MLRPLHVEIFCILVLYQQSIKGDIALRTLSKITDIHKAAPKVWHQYIEAFLRIQINLFVKDFHTCQDLIANQLILSKLMVIFSKQGVKVTLISSKINTVKLHFGLPNSVLYNDSKLEIYLVRTAFGAILNSYTPRLKCNFNYRWPLKHTWKWMFKLDGHLALNLTFHSLYFSSSTSDCIRGNMSICNSRISNERLSYCGQHSKFYAYVDLADITLSLHVFQYIDFKMDTSVQVIDKNLIATVEKNFGLVSTKPQSQLVILNKTLILTYLIKARKIDQIFMHLIPNFLYQYIVYDGPGFLSSIVKSEGNIYTLSTFQGFVQLAMKRDILFDDKMWLHYSSKKIENVIEVQAKHKTDVQLNIPQDKGNPIVIHVSTQFGFQVNLTIVKIVFQGTESKTCKYGGLVAAEELTDDYKESPTICKSHDGNASLSRSFYSHNSSLIIVLYWYEPYSEINATVNITQTKCRPIQMCPCTYYFLCERGRESHCKSYLRKVTQLSGVVFRLNKRTTLLEARWEVLFAFSDVKCFVLQINVNQTGNFMTNFGHLYKCKYFIAPNSIPQTDREITFQVRGSIKDFFHLVKCKDGPVPLDWIYFKKPDIVCPDTIRESRLKCPRSGVNKTDVLVSFKFKTPTYVGISDVAVSFFLYSETWIEMIASEAFVSKREISYRTEKLWISFHFDAQARLIGDSRQFVVAFKLQAQNRLHKQPLNQKLHLKLSLLSQFSVDINLFWDRRITVQRNWKYVSLPGVYKEVIFGKVKKLLFRYVYVNIMIIWIHDNYDKYSHFQRLSTDACTEDTNNDFHCLNFSSFKTKWSQNKEYYILLKRKEPRRHQRYSPHDQLSSWQNASDLCEQAGGTLPYFTKREELGELIALLKLSPDIPLFEAVFIGLAIKEDIPQWENGRPLTYQQYSNTNFGKVTHLSCRYKPDRPKQLRKCTDLSDIKLEALGKIFPSFVPNRTCTLMLLSNLAEPEWVNIDCSKRLLMHVFCIKNISAQESNLKINNKNVLNNKICPSNHFVKGKKCWFFVWYCRRESKHLHLEELCKNYHTISAGLTHIQMFHYLFDAITPAFPPFITMYASNRTLVNRLMYEKHLNIYEFKQDIISIQAAEGFHICMTGTKLVTTGANIFSCATGGYISSHYICDGRTDCPLDNSDEIFCICDKSTNINHEQMYRCKNRVLKSEEYICGPLYYQTIDGYYSKYTTLKIREDESQKEFILCKSGIKVDAVLKNDLVTDCGLDAEDEPVLKSLLRDGKTTRCSVLYQLPCRQGYSKCYNITDICLYKLNEYGHHIPCRTGEHLENCREFSCNKEFKCYESYCIPWSYVCNGKWDCPDGSDEFYSTCRNQSSCKSMYKCRKTGHMCIHLGNVCDNYADCPLKDDEYSCDLKSFKCPFGCNCLLLAVGCRNASFNMIYSGYPYMFVSIYRSCVFPIQDLTKVFPKATYFILLSNDLTTVCNANLFGEICFIDLGFNSIQHVGKDCFHSLTHLRTLIIDNNAITSLECRSFVNLIKLGLLNLSNNPITNIPRNFIINSPVLKVLSIRKISLTEIETNTFMGVIVELIDTTDFHICCISPPKCKCNAEQPWYISCADMLPNDKMRIFFIFISLLIVIMNSFSILAHVIAVYFKKTFLAIIIAINFNDILCAMYLGIIWMADLTYQGIFLVQEQFWRSGATCFTAFGILLWFTILTQFVLILLSLSRLMFVIHPIDTAYKRIDFVIKSLCYIFVGSFLLSLSLTLFIKLTIKKLPFTLCLPFLDPSNSLLIFKVIIWCVVISQLFTSVVIITSHILLVLKFLQSQKLVRISRNKTNNGPSTILVTQLVLVTVSNVLCWFPANGVYISALYLSKYPIDLVIWTTVAVLPINSIVNPAIFLTTSLKRLIKAGMK